MAKLKKSLFFLVILTFILIPFLAFGVEIINPLGKQTNTITDLAKKIADFLLTVGAPISTIMILWAGFLFMTSGGSEEKLAKAKRTLTWAVVGLGILILNWGIAAIIQDVLSGKF